MHHVSDAANKERSWRSRAIESGGEDVLAETLTITRKAGDFSWANFQISIFFSGVADRRLYMSLCRK